MDESHRQNERSQTQKRTLHGSVYVKDKHRQNKSMTVEVGVEFTCVEGHSLSGGPRAPFVVLNYKYY